MSDAITIKGLYGRGTPCQVFVSDGWYVIEGSCNVNWCSTMLFPEALAQPVNVEILCDSDHLVELLGDISDNGMDE